MQMTMTFAFDDTSEAAIFFAEMSEVLNKAGSKLASLFGSSAKAKLPPPEKTARRSLPEPETDDEIEADETVKEAPKARKSVGAKTSEAVLSGGGSRERVTKTAPAAPVDDLPTDPKKRRLGLLGVCKELVNVVIKGDIGGGKKAVEKIWKENKITGRLADATDEQIDAVKKELEALRTRESVFGKKIDDEIPF